jgi:diguanylate cyclase
MPTNQILTSLIARMRADIRLAIVTLYCLCSFALITPFGIYRLHSGDVLIGLVDLAIVAIFISLAVLAWKPGKSRLAADLTACSATLAVMAVVLALELSYLWAFSTLVGNFLMARLPVALVASTVLVVSLSIYIPEFASMTERLTFLTVASMVSLFSLIFATRVDLHYADLSNIASRDALTGAYNRRAMDLDLQSITQFKEESTDCLVLMDLDEFKQLNDRHGHDEGDRVLAKLVKVVEARTRAKDRFYRYGGEEFVLLLPRTSLTGAHIALANLRTELVSELEGPDGPVTLSMGLAQRLPGETPQDWLKRADRALLEAKRSGKNRVVTAA